MTSRNEAHSSPLLRGIHASKDALFRSQNEREKEHAIIYVMRGAVKGFLVYTVPMSIIRRKPAGFRRGLILAVFTGLVRTFDRLFKYMNRKGAAPLPFNLQRKLSPHALAGGLAALIGVLLDRSLLNSTFVFWCIVRALRCLPLPNVPHGDTLIMCLSASQILTTWVRTPEDLPGGYRKFLNIHGGTAQKARQTVNQRATAAQVFCPIVHPQQSCMTYNTTFMKDALIRAVPVYGPLYLLLFAFSGRFNLSGVKRLVINICQSSLFLSTYCTLSWLSGCIFYNLFKVPTTRLTLLLHLWIPGLAALIERPSRRPELAAYCLTFALDSLYQRAKTLGYVQSRKWIGAVFIILSMAVMTHHHHLQPPLVTKWLFGLSDRSPARRV